MCLVISILLAVMSVNFFLNGFILQAVIMGSISLAFAYFMYRNLGCPNGSCAPKLKDKEETDDN